MPLTLMRSKIRGDVCKGVNAKPAISITGRFNNNITNKTRLA